MRQSTCQVCNSLRLDNEIGDHSNEDTVEKMFGYSMRPVVLFHLWQ